MVVSFRVPAALAAYVLSQGIGLATNGGIADRARAGASRASAVMPCAAGCQETLPRARAARAGGLATQSARVRTSAESDEHPVSTRSAAIKRTGQALSERASRIATQSVCFGNSSRKRSRQAGSEYLGGGGRGGNES